MMRLVRVELDRFRSRRLNQMTVLGIFGVLLLVLFAGWNDSAPASDTETALAQANYDVNVREWEKNGEEQIASCLADEAIAQEVDPETDWGCDQMGPGTLDDWIMSPPTFAESATDVIPGIGLVLAFAAFAMGVSFIAAEFAHGAIGNWLTFEPRRTRVYGSKVAAAGISAVPVAVVTSLLAVTGTWAMYAVHDHLGDLTSTVWGDVAVSGARVILVTVGFTMLGVAVGTIVRSTAAAIGILVGYMVVVEGLLAGLVAPVRPYLLQLSLEAVVNGRASYWAEECAGPVCETVEKTVSLTHGAITLTIVLVVVGLVAGVVFRRRDVS